MTSINFKHLEGKVLLKIEQVLGDENDEIIFTTNEGEVFKMNHYQDCCESVSIESIVGDLDDLIGYPILRSEENTNSKSDEVRERRETWTFYKLATQKGYVDIRWYGSSNGYYSEAISFSQQPSLSYEQLIKINIEKNSVSNNEKSNRFKF